MTKSSKTESVEEEPVNTGGIFFNRVGGINVMSSEETDSYWVVGWEERPDAANRRTMKVTMTILSARLESETERTFPKDE